ncbi:MAG: DNA-processing protein DprA, partial [Gemmatimonadota bacterium]|nr:DNA-processing protein DprA [Gemmatimonadota bacterium]
HPPGRLYVLGNPDSLSEPRVSIVGTRQSTAYGERVTRSLTSALVRAGVCVISGMARGIDGTAHRAALDQGGRTVAILGTGIDVPYPAGHRHLHRTIVERGLVLSENPPGMTAYQGAFPRRNRIIAALAPVTIVVEAGRRSGALNTAGQALELGRIVAAVPGPIDSEQCVGSNELLRDGAVVIASVDDALALLGVSLPKGNDVDLPEPERRLWDCLGAGPADIDRLSERTGLAVAQCLAGVSSLEIRGLVQCSLAGEITRI